MLLKDAPIELPGTLKQSNECPVCGVGMETAIDLPQFPLTEMYEPWSEDFEPGRGLVDQAFLFCGECSHGKLETIVPPKLLYGEHYRTRTRASVGATQAVYRFSHFVARYLDLSRFETVIDIGANDGELLMEFEQDGLERIAVDPHASGEGLTLIRKPIEEADLSHLRGRHKLILSSHTLEHIESPAAFFEKVNSLLFHGDYLALQFPSLDLLVRDARIDHIHHQHVHYYSHRSVALLLAKYGLEIRRVEFDDQHYGTLRLLARRGEPKVPTPNIKREDVDGADQLFMSDMAVIDKSLKNYSGAVAFGAALMLPILAYYAPALSHVDYIADNDHAKDGLRYINFDKPVRYEYELCDRDVVITGIATKAAARSLVQEAFDKGARNVIVPLHTL